MSIFAQLTPGEIGLTFVRRRGGSFPRPRILSRRCNALDFALAETHRRETRAAAAVNDASPLTRNTYAMPETLSHRPESVRYEIPKIYDYQLAATLVAVDFTGGVDILLEEHQRCSEFGHAINILWAQ